MLLSPNSPPCTEVTGADMTMPGLCVGAEDLNSGPPAYTASVLTTDLSPQSIPFYLEVDVLNYFATAEKG